MNGPELTLAAGQLPPPIGAESCAHSMTTTVARQETAVGEGLVLGAVMLGLSEIGGTKQALESDFGFAWRNWAHRDRFPSIKTGPAQYSIVGILGRSANWRPPAAAYWTGNWPFIPVVSFPEWGFDSFADHIDQGIPASAWMDLVRLWQPAK